MIDDIRKEEFIENTIKNNSKLSEDVLRKAIATWGPKKLYKLNLLNSNSEGWRAGYTKPTLKKRTEERRMKKKRCRAMQKRNR